jgi:ATP-dependent Lon protease
VAHVDQVLEHALTAQPLPIEWTEADDLASQPSPQLQGPDAATLAH